jgi:prepilin-type processing-associated H-X9-DG protein
MGNPDHGVGPRQEGGWIYQVSDYLENQNVKKIGSGGLTGAALRAALKNQALVVLPIFNCPSRRPSQLYPNYETVIFNADPSPEAAKSDYAANGGHSVSDTSGRPANSDTLTDCKDPNIPGSRFPICNFPNNDNWIVNFWTGIVADRAGARIAQITDGTTKTAAGGEKWVSQYFYEVATNKASGQPSDNPADNSSMYQGYDQDTVREISGSFDGSTPQGSLPRRDADFIGDPKTAGNSYPHNFGSAHPTHVNMVMCDGSVQTYDFDVDPLVWNAIGGRADGDLN